MAEIKYEITKELGVVSENQKGWKIELNMISWNDNPPKYDIRNWSPGRERMGKGITLTEGEMEAVVKLFEERNEEDSFE